MFEQLDQKVGKSGLRWTIWLGGLIVALLVGSMVLVQALWPETVRSLTILAKESLLAPTPPHTVEAVAPEQPKQKTQQQFTVPKQVFHAPSAIPPKINMEPEPPSEAPPIVAVCLSCVVGGIPGVPPGGLGRIDVAFVPPAPPPLPAPKEQAKPAATKQVRVGGDVRPPSLIKQLKPVYPPLAKAARVQGTVRFTAVIARDGSIQQLRLIDGPPLLIQAATNAVRQWSYSPTLLNGEPVEVITEIEVRFTLSQ
jgi:protein TonB